MTTTIFVVALATVLMFLVVIAMGATVDTPSAVDQHSSGSSVLRRLEEQDAASADQDLNTRNRYYAKKAGAKQDRMKRMLDVINMKGSVVGDLQPQNWSAQHKLSGPAIFTVALTYAGADPNVLKADAQNFMGTARKVGYDGDFVVGLSPGGYKGAFLAKVMETGSVVYEVDLECGDPKKDKEEKCNFKSRPDIRVSINMIRFFLYQYWSSLYHDSAMIMVADFRDMLFQSNPFTYQTDLWMPPVSQLTVFQEAYPLKVIYRCPFNSQWIISCYGSKALKKVGSNPVSCSGASIGTKNAILIYTYLMTQQLDPKVRWGKDSTRNNKGCLSLGMDQGLHNWLIYSGILDRYMDVKIFSQGEGPVNNIGAFFPGKNALLKFNLSEWRLLRGEKGNKYFHNWNGDKSPAVHQYDRFLESDLKGGIKEHLGVLRGLN